MKISLIKNNKLLEYKLPERVEGNIWLNEIDNKGIERNIINVEAAPDGKWRLISNNDYYIASSGKKLPFAILEENNMIVINHAYSTCSVLLFTSPLYEKNVTFFTCTNELSIGLTVGKGERNNIFPLLLFLYHPFLVYLHRLQL